MITNHQYLSERFQVREGGYRSPAIDLLVNKILQICHFGPHILGKPIQPPEEVIQIIERCEPHQDRPISKVVQVTNESAETIEQHRPARLVPSGILKICWLTLCCAVPSLVVEPALTASVSRRWHIRVPVARQVRRYVDGSWPAALGGGRC